MPIYKYQCVTKLGENISGNISGNSEIHAMDKLRKMNYNVLKIKRARFEKLERFVKNEKPVKVGDLSLFSRQLASMIGAGIPVTRSISTIASQITNKSFKTALENISKNVESGMNLTDAFGGYPHIFNDLYLSLIESGEIGGMLEEALLRISDQMYKDKKIKDAVKSATFYPKIVLTFAGVILVAMVTFLVPTFQGMTQNNDDIPLITKIIYDFSDSFRAGWYYYILAIIVFVIVIKTIFGSRKGQQVWDRWKIKIPLMGPINYLTLVARFSRTLSTLLGGGIPVVQALTSSGDTSGNSMVARKVRQATVNIEQGNKISDEIGKLELFPNTVVHMINIGEETGQLPELLDRIALFYEDEVETKTKGLSTILEPLMLIGVGLVVGGMLIALYMPIFTAVSSQM
ncbi:MAG: type II secretion system F family protein [Clostridia bacterium]|nr:type II secretion system F family protein [Clostridia bacterium]